MGTDWRELIGKRVLVRRPMPWPEDPIREAVVAEVSPGGHLRLEFVLGRAAEKGGTPDWYDAKEWTLLEVLG